MSNPGDINPIVLGIVLPSAGTMLWIFIGLFGLCAIASMVLWTWCNAVGERQYADPATRAAMHLDITAGPFGSRVRPAAARLAEPERCRALRWHDWLNWTVLALCGTAAVTMWLYLSM